MANRTEQSGKSGALIAVVGAVASVLVAFITTWGTIKATENKLEATQEKVSDVAETAGQLRKDLGVPLGTVIASVLVPSDFSQVVGDDAVFHPEKSKWAPADGRDVGRSSYGRITDRETAPDLRGLFLRGLNSFDSNRPSRADGFQDPENRTVISLQMDAFQGHFHRLENGTAVLRNVTTRETRNGTGTWDSSTLQVKEPISDGENGNPRIGAETRPKNTAVYYYIKINNG